MTRYNPPPSQQRGNHTQTLGEMMRSNMTNKKNANEFINVRIPSIAVVGENKKSVLINAIHFNFWLPKKFIQKSKLSDFLTSYTLGLIDNWKYKYIVVSSDSQKETSGTKLADALKKVYKLYQVSEKAKATNEELDDIEIGTQDNNDELDDIVG